MIDVKCFAIVAEIIGKDSFELDLEVLESPTIASLWTYLERVYPALEGKKKYIRFSKNLSFVPLDECLHKGDEIGIIPPVAGG